MGIWAYGVELTGNGKKQGLEGGRRNIGSDGSVKTHVLRQRCSHLVEQITAKNQILPVGFTQVEAPSAKKFSKLGIQSIT